MCGVCGGAGEPRCVGGRNAVCGVVNCLFREVCVKRQVCGGVRCGSGVVVVAVCR